PHQVVRPLFRLCVGRILRASHRIVRAAVDYPRDCKGYGWSNASWMSFLSTSKVRRVLLELPGHAWEGPEVEPEILSLPPPRVRGAVDCRFLSSDQILGRSNIIKLTVVLPGRHQQP